MEDWIQELLPDFAGDMGLGNGVTHFPSSSSFRSSYNIQHNGSIAATTSNNNRSSRMQLHQQQSGFPPQVWQNQAADHRPPTNVHQFQMQSNSYATIQQALQNQESIRMLAFHQAQNLSLGDQMFPGNQPQTMRLGGIHPLPESAPPPALPNSVDWVDEAYHKILLLKEAISTEVLTFQRRSQLLRQLATTPEAANYHEKMMIYAERVINFARMTRADIVQWPKENLYHNMSDAVKYFKYARFQNAVSRQPATTGVRVENNFQLNIPVRSGAPPYQMQQPVGPFRVDNHSVADQANAKRQRGAGRKKEEKKPTRFSGLNGGQVDGKDSTSSPATVSVSPSSSAFLSPMTPCSKPSDFAKSPMSVDESCRIPPSACPNGVVADERNTDPVKRLVGAVMSMSPRALNSAIQDTSAVTSLTDRIATGLVHSGSTKVALRDLADDVSKCRKQSATKDEMETETGFCARGSAKRLKKEPHDFLLQEIKEINQRFMEVKVDVMNMDDVSRMGFDGDVLIRCSYIPVGPASQQMAPKLVLELIVPAGYPNFSPTVSDKMRPGCCDFEDGENLWTKAKSGFSLKLRKLGEPITVEQMARAWEDSSREVFLEYAERMGGGSLLTSKRYSYGNWESLAVAF